MSKENSQEWLYICIDCGRQVHAGADFQEDCPGCGGSRWLCHLIKNEKSQGKTIKDIGVEICHPLTSPLSANPKGDTTTSLVGKTQEKEKSRSLPDDLITQLASQGLGCKAIESKLLEQGIVISYRTIARRLQGPLL